MNKVLLFSFLLVLSLYCFTGAEGIECYQCGYIDGVPDNIRDAADEYIDIDKSCRSDKKPKKDFLTECQTGQVCGKLSVAVEDIEATARGCFPKLEELNNQCATKTLREMAEWDGVPEQLKEALANYPDVGDVEVSACTCDADKCNSSSMLKMAHNSLCLFSLVFLASKFVGII